MLGELDIVLVSFVFLQIPGFLLEEIIDSITRTRDNLNL